MSYTVRGGALCAERIRRPCMRASVGALSGECPSQVVRCELVNRWAHTQLCMVEAEAMLSGIPCRVGYHAGWDTGPRGRAGGMLLSLLCLIPDVQTWIDKEKARRPSRLLARPYYQYPESLRPPDPLTVALRRGSPKSYSRSAASAMRSTRSGTRWRRSCRRPPSLVRSPPSGSTHEHPPPPR